MARNIEIKARVDHWERLHRAARDASETAGERLRQEDVFYAAPSGRLKLRVLAHDRGELIHYHRPDTPGPKESAYRIAPTRDPAAMRAILDAVLPVVGVVRKERLLYMLGQTRVHLDRVEGLGDFVELEVVLRPEQEAGEGERIARKVMERLGIAEESLVEGAYLDLLRERS